MSRLDLRSAIKALVALAAIALALLFPEWRNALRAGIYNQGSNKAEEPFNKGVKLDPKEDKDLLKNLQSAATEITNLAKAVQAGKAKPPAGIKPDDYAKQLEKAETCLNKMLELGKIEKEMGSANGSRAATTQTVPKGKRQDCDPQNSDMNVNPNNFTGGNVNAFGGIQELAAILVHEYTHTTQGTEPAPDKVEKEGYAAEAAALESFLSESQFKDNPILQDRLKLIKQMADDPPGSLKGIRTPTGGFDFVLSADALSQYTFFYETPELRGQSLAGPAYVSTVFPLAMAHPLSIVRLEGKTSSHGNEIVFIGGIANDGFTGVIEALEVKNGMVLSVMAILNRPGSHPFAMAYDASTNSAFVLDTLADVVFVLAPGADGIPETALPKPYAGRKDFPDIARSFGLSLNRLTPRSVILSDDDRRGVDHVNLDADLTALYDLNADGIADDSFSLTRREAVTFPPGFFEPVTAGLHNISISGSFHAQVQARATDAAGSMVLEVLGQEEVRHGNTEKIHLSRKLAGGEYLQLVDLTFGYKEVPVQVSP